MLATRKPAGGQIAASIINLYNSPDANRPYLLKWILLTRSGLCCLYCGLYTSLEVLHPQVKWRGFDRVEEKKNKAVSSSVSCCEPWVSCQLHGWVQLQEQLQVCDGGDPEWSGPCAKLSASSALEQPRSITPAGPQQGSTNSSETTWDALSAGLEQEAALALQFPWLVHKSAVRGLAANSSGLQLTSPIVLQAGTLQGTFLGL